MNLPVRRRSLRRHSTSTLQNDNKNTRGSATDNGILKGRINKKRLSVGERSLNLDENNLNVRNQSNKFHRTSCPKINENCVILPLRPLTRISEFPNYNEKNLVSSIESRDVYESLMDIEQALDEVENDVRRRSKRLCVINKQNIISLKSSQDNVTNLPVLNRPLKQNRRKSTSFDEGDSDVHLIVKKKRRKLSEDSTPQKDDLYHSPVSDKATNSRTVNRTETENSLSSKNDAIEIQKYYLDKTIRDTTSLETIFEENPNLSKAMGKRKIKRFIPFAEIIEYKTRKSSECMRKLNSRRKKSVDIALEIIQDDDLD